MKQDKANLNEDLSQYRQLTPRFDRLGGMEARVWQQINARQQGNADTLLHFCKEWLQSFSLPQLAYASVAAAIGIFSAQLYIGAPEALQPTATTALNLQVFSPQQGIPLYAMLKSQEG